MFANAGNECEKYHSNVGYISGWFRLLITAPVKPILISSTTPHRRREQRLSLSFTFTFVWPSLLNGAINCVRWTFRFAFLPAHLLCSVSLRKLSRVLYCRQQSIIMFLQSLPTQDWTDKNTELLLSEAFMWSRTFEAR